MTHAIDRNNPAWREQQCRLWDEEYFAEWLRDEFAMMSTDDDLKAMIRAYMNNDDAELGRVMRTRVIRYIQGNGHDWILGYSEYSEAPESVRRRIEREAEPEYYEGLRECWCGVG